jgi:hypothetical protein
MVAVGASVLFVAVAGALVATGATASTVAMLLLLLLVREVSAMWGANRWNDDGVVKLPLPLVAALGTRGAATGLCGGTTTFAVAGPVGVVGAPGEDAELLLLLLLLLCECGAAALMGGGNCVVGCALTAQIG